MSESKKGPSCFGLFVKSWILSALALSGMTAAGVGCGVKFMGWNAATWTQIDGWTSYPSIALLCIAALSTALAFAVAAFIGVASAFLSGGKGRSKTAPSRSKPRPQSQRKTTV